MTGKQKHSRKFHQFQLTYSSKNSYVWICVNASSFSHHVPFCLFPLPHNVRQKVEPEFWIAKFGFGNKLVDLLIC